MWCHIYNNYYMRDRDVIVDTSFVSTWYFVLLILVTLYYHCLICFLTICLFEFFSSILSSQYYMKKLATLCIYNYLQELFMYMGFSLPLFDHKSLDSWYTKFQTIIALIFNKEIISIHHTIAYFLLIWTYVCLFIWKKSFISLKLIYR